jgi:chemotaxis protein histidine kinase CheA
MDREHQARLNFLAEAEQYYDRMESVLVGLAEQGIQTQQLDELLRLVHSIKGGAGMMGFIPLSQVAHRLEDFLKILRVHHPSQRLDHELETFLVEGIDRLRQISECHREGTEVTEPWLTEQTQPLFTQLQQRLGELHPEDENALLAVAEDTDIRLIMVASGEMIVSQPAPASTPVVVAEPLGKTVRVPLEQLQYLNTLCSDLVLERNALKLRLEQLQGTVARLKQMNIIPQVQEIVTTVELGMRDVGQVAQRLEQTTQALQQNATRMQMRPFSELVERFPKTVQDWSNKFGKPVHLKLIGASTLLTQEAIEGLSDPLLHLLRNAFDHGIEPPTCRLADGKPEQGTITLRATHQGSRTLITISDDGQGINLEQVREKACKLGFPESLRQTTNLPDLLALIFAPGFSTAEQVGELSGRGVGLDVVQTNLWQLGGDVQVATRAGMGTTFTLSLPFNLSVLSVLVVETAGLLLAISVDSVREVLCPTPEQLMLLAGKEYLQWQTRTVPLARLEPWLVCNRPGQSLPLERAPSINRSAVVLVGEGANLRGVYVDRVWGEQEVAIRPIMSLLPLPPGFFSSSILGDGRVVPLVDLIQLTDARPT